MMNKVLSTLLFFKKNIYKVLVLFFVGFGSRYIVNYYWDINVFVDFTSMVSIIYYLNMSCIIVYINNMDLQFNGLKHSLLGITYDDFLNVIKVMLDIDNLKMSSMNWEGCYLNNNDHIQKSSGVLSMNNPQGGNQQGDGWYDSEGSVQEYTGPSRYLGPEPMDIPALSQPERRQMLIYLSKVRDAEDGPIRLTRGTPTMSQILKEIEKNSGPETSYGISKKLYKFVWSHQSRFSGQISNTGRIMWSRIGVGPDSQIMIALRDEHYSGGSAY